jgi:hypothetical protein
MAAVSGASFTQTAHRTAAEALSISDLSSAASSAWPRVEEEFHMNAIVSTPHATVLAPAPDAFLAMIERASKDPEINIDKLQRLLDMRAQEYARIAILHYSEAMAQNAAHGVARQIKQAGDLTEPLALRR